MVLFPKICSPFLHCLKKKQKQELPLWLLIHSANSQFFEKVAPKAFYLPEPLFLALSKLLF